jgi:hypothetical protein
MQSEYTEIAATTSDDPSLLSRLERMSDNTELWTLLTAIRDEDAPLILKRRYWPTYFNLFHLFHKQLPKAQIRHIAAEVAKAAAWNSGVVERCTARYPEHPVQLHLSGWDQHKLRNLLSAGKGLIVPTFRFGAYPFVPMDLAAMGFPLTLPLGETEQSQRTIDELRKRLDVTTDLDAEQRRTFENICSTRLLHVHNKNSSISLARALRRGELMMVYADSNSGADGQGGDESRIQLDFLGSPIRAKTGVARLSYALGTPILPLISLRTGPTTGMVHLTDPIFPPASKAPGDAENYEKTTMRKIYSILETYVRQQPEQFVGFADMHRWRHRAATNSARPPMGAQQAAAEVASALQGGRHLRVDELGGVTTLCDDGQTWVDAESMKAFQVPTWAASLGRALISERGVDHSTLSTQGQTEASLRLLAVMYSRRLLAVL